MMVFYLVSEFQQDCYDGRPGIGCLKKRKREKIRV